MNAEPGLAVADAGEARRSGALPNLIVIGAQKCGTSALHFYLDLHPEISMSKTKELNFFVRRRNWERGLDWYRSNFDPEAPVRGESSPNYTAHPLFRGVPRRMRSVVPDARLVYIVRDPLERIGAHWVHNYARGRTREGLGEIVVRRRRTYVARSRYHMQLRRFLRHYPLERILVLDQADLRHRREETLRRVFEFAGVDPDFTHPHFRREHHRTERKARPTRLGRRLEERRARTRRRLLPDQAWAVARTRWPLARPIERPDPREAVPEKVVVNLRRDAERLRELTGRRFEHWSIWER
jgi:hypothetical protein